uniref:Uncharacterized protein n=1 Tax=Ditylenchus dipsaci TaxID=166011 RepID=A0A915EQK6_9BILA
MSPSDYESSNESLGETEQLEDVFCYGNKNSLVSFYPGRNKKMHLLYEGFFFVHRCNVIKLDRDENFEQEEGDVQKLVEVSNPAEMLQSFACRCCRDGCQKIVLLHNRQYYKERGEHDHDANPVSLECRKLLFKSMGMVEKDHVTRIGDIITAAEVGVPEAVIAAMKYQTWRKARLRHRKVFKAYPAGSTSPNKLVIPPDWSTFPDWTPLLSTILALDQRKEL